MGGNAILLATNSGYEVIGTSWLKKFGRVKKFGASQVFDYHGNTVQDELVSTLKGKMVASFLDCVGSVLRAPCSRYQSVKLGGNSAIISTERVWANLLEVSLCRHYTEGQLSQWGSLQHIPAGGV
ncbi:hypothetical protein GGS23DRAFT_82 [Durotheca rogersii]|uniref:uncharacterized protein n=1 Tax=Durotheca rogersii TaxID=419775 RepID=UPI00222086AE|nr:uncharacterized protein GGS23DRAFT_82 [Durotheca rogersii]KAI5867887.1 hypothetical protein GGS23DRAFT_82 [Durotheca rogersii]